MAGPGGGPPRKSHTKSRKGCRTCKRRHIRCDESYPQCRNCTKHSCRCDYMDNPPPPDDVPKMPPGPNLLWTPNVEAEIDNWVRTGNYPFPELMLHRVDQFNNLSNIDRRLIHHISTIYRDLQQKGLLGCTAWVDKLPIFLDLTAGNDFVMSAILAFSATNLATKTKSVETRNLAYHHRGVALNGLHTAIGNFSEVNSDPILAASILLSWQASDWAGWTSLMSGITSVLSSMTEWRSHSILAEFVERHVQAIDRDPLFMPPSMGGSMGGMMAPMLPEDDQSLQEGLSALQHLLPYVQNDATLSQFIKELISNASEIETCSRTMRDEQLFDKLQPMRMRLLWVPIHLVQAIKNTDSNFMALAHLYSIAMAIDASLPELKGAAFGALVTAPLEDIDKRLIYNSPQTFDGVSHIDDVMNFPRHIAGRTRQARGSLDATMPPDLNAGQHSPFSLQNLHLDSGPTTPAWPPTYPGFMGNNLSAEDLNLSVPPSPFLNSFVSNGSRRHSGLAERVGSRPNSMNFDRRSFSGFSGIGPGDSPAYSPQAYSPVPSQYLEDDHSSLPGEQGSWAYAAGFPYDESADKNKDRALSWQGTPPHM